MTRQGRERGQATVELALVTPFVVALVLLAGEVAVLARDSLRIEHAAREAARVLAVDDDVDAARRSVARIAGPRATVELSRASPTALVRATVRAPLSGSLVLGRLGPLRHVEATVVMRREGVP